MTFDKPEHQQFLFELMKQAQYPGNLLELAFEVKQAIASGSVAAPSAVDEANHT